MPRSFFRSFLVRVADAKFVASGVREGVPRKVRLAAGAEMRGAGLHPLLHHRFALDVGAAIKIEVETVLAGGGIFDALKSQCDRGSRSAHDAEPAV